MRRAPRCLSSPTTRPSPPAPSGRSPSATDISRKSPAAACTPGRTGIAMRRRARRRNRVTLAEPSRLRPHDLGSEALAGLLQRPGRSVLTMLGTVLGIGAFVAIVGLTETATGQIGKEFNAQDATQVTVTDVAAYRTSKPTLDFPPNADALIGRIHGVIAAGVWWNVPLSQAAVSAMPTAGGGNQIGLPVIAATPGALQASGAKLAAGVLFNEFHESRAQNVAVVSQTAAAQLG